MRWHNFPVFLLLGIILFTSSSNCLAQWNTTGSNIYFNTGHVGIGVSYPRAELDVNGEIWAGGEHVNNSVSYGVGKVTLGRDHWGGGYIQFAGDNNLGYGPTAPQIQTMWIHVKSNGNYMEISSPEVADIFVANKSGNVGIGTINPNSKLTVNGNIRAKEIKLEASNWPDYVFSEEYHLIPLKELKSEIAENGHLPGFRTASEYQDDGVDIMAFNQKLLEKIEELTLYTIQQDILIEAQTIEIDRMTSHLEKLGEMEKELNEIKKLLSHGKND